MSIQTGWHRENSILKASTQKKPAVVIAVTVKTFADYHDMLVDKSIDAVMITTPDHWHSQPAIEAALAGKHIYVQKPTSLTITEGRLLSDVVKKKESHSPGRYPAAFMDSVQGMPLNLYRNGRIGKLHTVKIGLPGDPSGPEAPEHAGTEESEL